MRTLWGTKNYLLRAASKNGYIESYHTPVKNRIKLMRDIPNLLSSHPIPVGVTEIVVEKFDNGTIAVKKFEKYHNGVTIKLMNYNLPCLNDLKHWDGLAELVE